MAVEYRYKPDKHKFRENILSIDEIHRAQITKFKNNIIDIPKKREELNKLKEELDSFINANKTKPINFNMENIKNRNNLKKKISKLEHEIKNIENHNDEMEYYSKTGGVIYDYYDLTNGTIYNKFNEGTKLEDTNNIKPNGKINISSKLSNLINLNRKRKIKKPIKRRNKKQDGKKQKSIMSYLLKDDNTETISKKDSICKATLQNEYLLMMDKEYACSKSKINPVKKCENCNLDKITIYLDSIIVCPKCGIAEDIVTATVQPTYGDVFNEKPKYPYRRIGHCIEKLNQFLCKGNINIPIEVFNILELEIEKHGLTKDKITIKFLERMLKKHKKSNYYEYIMYIYNKLTGTPPKVLSQDEYERILKMFMDANEVYETKYKPSNRNNFLKYTFVLHKIFMTIGKHSYAQYFKILKSEIKLKEQEKIWEQICLDLGWKYHAGSYRNPFSKNGLYDV